MSKGRGYSCNNCKALLWDGWEAITYYKRVDGKIVTKTGCLSCLGRDKGWAIMTSRDWFEYYKDNPIEDDVPSWL